MDTVYYDWSIRRGVVWARESGDGLTPYEIVPDMKTLLEKLDRPTNIVCEATFGSFYLPERYEFITLCEKAGHTILTVPTRTMTRLRYQCGFVKFDENGKPKNKAQGYVTDYEDIQCMRFYTMSGGHLKKPNTPTERQLNLAESVAEELMRLRSTGYKVPRPKAEGYTFHSQKDDFAQEVIARLPAFDSLTDVQRIALGDGRGYNHVVIGVVGVIAKYATNRKEFDFLSGMYGHAYGSQARADLMHYAWAGGNKRPHLNADKKRDDITLSEYRRELRWLYHQLKN